MSAPVAVVDLGTHSCLLLIGRLGPGGGLELLEERCEIPRLGEGLDQSGQISARALGRVGALLADYDRRAKQLGCKQLHVGATAAVRRAQNRREVCAELEALGFVVDVISEAREGRLGWAAVAGDEPTTCIVDVGGGSTELVTERGQRVRSVPIGAVVLTECMAGASWEQLRAAARAQLAPADAVDAAEAGAGAAPWVALGGTPTNLASLELGLTAFDHRAVEGQSCSVASAERWGRELASMPLEARRGLGIEPDRAEVLPAGFACLAAALEGLGVSSFRVSGRGLRNGLLAEQLGIV